MSGLCGVAGGSAGNTKLPGHKKPLPREMHGGQECIDPPILRIRDKVAKFLARCPTVAAVHLEVDDAAAG